MPVTFTGPDAGDEVNVSRNGRTIATLLWDGETLHDLDGTPPEDAVLECIAHLDVLVNNGVFHASV